MTGDQGNQGNQDDPFAGVDWDALVEKGFREPPETDPTPPWLRPGARGQGTGAGGGRGSGGEQVPLYDVGYGIASPLHHAIDAFTPKPDYYSTLELWIEYKLKEKIWSKQKEISASLKRFRYTAVQSCHGAGKSYIASRAIANWIDAHPPGDAFVVTTAPTAAQVSAILWREVQKAHRRGSLDGNIVTAGYPQWKLQGELVGYGRKPADYAESAFQGIHAPYVLIVIDEAAGVDQKLFNAVDALATNKNCRVLAIGNPDDPTSHFANVCKPNSGWNVIRIDGMRSPNFTRANVRMLIEEEECLQCQLQGRATSLVEDLMKEEDIEYSTEPITQRVSDSLISPLWVEERLHRWVGNPSGDNTIAKLASQSSLFTAKVRGIFPESNTDGLIPLGWVEAAVQRWHDWNDRGRPFDVRPRLVVGADIARFGEDQTSLALRRGPAILEIRSHHYADTMETTGYITALLGDPNDITVVDVIGVGAGVVDRLREIGKPCIPFNAAAAAKLGTGQPLKDRSREFTFLNLRSAAWWNLRELLDPSRGSTLMLPDSEMLRADLTTPTYKVKSGGAIQVESKDDIRKRLGRSTDEGDSVVQAFWTDSESAEFYTQSGSAVSWWRDSEPEDDLEALRWVAPDATERWLIGKEQQIQDEDWTQYGGRGSSAPGRVGRGGHHEASGFGAW